MNAFIFQAKHWLQRQLREGWTYERTLREITPNLWHTREQWQAYQLIQLQKTLCQAYQDIPYYRQLFKTAGILPSDIKTPDDLAQLPLMDKHTLREQGSNLVNPKIPRWMRYEKKTSGTTGTPCTLVRDLHSASCEQAFITRHRRWAGDTGGRRLNLRSHDIVPLTQQEPPFWRFNQADNELLMSIPHLSLKTAPYFIEAIQAYQPEICISFPSGAALLAEMFDVHGADYTFQRVFTSSEVVSDEMKERIETVFHCPVSDWYGLAERVSAIGQCSYGTYHIMEDYALTELIPADDGYEVVGTSFNNRSMPLIRYRTGDIVIPSDDTCLCGSSFRTISAIKGRISCHLMRPEGGKFFAVTCIPLGVPHLIETQFHQDRLEHVEIRVVTTPDFCEADAQQLIDQVHSLVSPNIQATVKQVEQIPRGPRGKFLSAICEVND